MPQTKFVKFQQKMKKRCDNRGRVLWVSCQLQGDRMVGFSEKVPIQGTYVRGK